MQPITWKGKTQKLARWAEEIGINVKTLYYRIDSGWSIDKALSTPLRKKDIGLCINHPDRPIETNGLCASCYIKSLYDAYSPEKKEILRGRRLASNAKRYATLDKTELAHNQRERRYKHRYGITIAEYNTRLAEQNNKCAICCEVEYTEEARLYVDHDHSTNVVRALLCPRCNTAMGIIDKGEAFMKKCVAYAEKYKSNGEIK